MKNQKFLNGAYIPLWFWKLISKCAKSLVTEKLRDRDFLHFSEDGVKLKIPPEITLRCLLYVLVLLYVLFWSTWSTTTKIKDLMLVIQLNRIKELIKKLKIENVKDLIALKTTTVSCDQQSYLQTNLMQTRFFILLKQEETWFRFHITHHFNDFFFFSADWNSLFRKVRWSDIMNLKIGRAAQCVLLCFARICKFCTATRRKTQLSCAWVKCGAERTMDERCLFQSGSLFLVFIKIW